MNLLLTVVDQGFQVGGELDGVHRRKLSFPKHDPCDGQCILCIGLARTAGPVSLADSEQARDL